MSNPTAEQEVHEPPCDPASRCAVCWPDDDSVIKALVAERDVLQKALDMWSKSK